MLGANEANTLEMASAYGTIATGGQRVDPIPVVTVTAADGSILWQADPRPQQVIDPPVASAAIDILSDAVLYGTGNAANIGRPQFGKTGTDDTNVNAWFVGAIPQLTAAVWVGYHAGQIPMVPPRTRTTVYGGTYPAQIWRLLMLGATDGMPREAFPTPEVDYVAVAIDGSQNPPCLPNPYTLPQYIQTVHFIVGTEPTQVCTSPDGVQDVPVPSVVGLGRTAATGSLERAGFYVRVEAEPSTQPPGHRDRAAPHRRDVRDADGHRRHHRGVDARPLTGRGEDTHGESARLNRHGRSTARRMPTRRDATTRPGGLPRSSHTVRPSTRSSPSCRRSSPKAAARRPGPRQRSRSGTPPRRARMTAIPRVGSAARSSTALPTSTRSVTTLQQWWMP